MIINIRGTSGSGKSTLVRSIRSLYLGATLKFREEGRKQPIGYVCNRALAWDGSSTGRPLGLVGHYETDCGGCDTIAIMDKIFQLAMQAHQKGLDVIFEGLLISADVNRTVELWKYAFDSDNSKNEDQLHVIALDVPIEECLDSVNARRRGKDQRRWEAASLQAMEQGRQPEMLVLRDGVNPKNTISKHKGVKQSCSRLVAAGVPVHVLGRVAAYNKIKELLGL